MILRDDIVRVARSYIGTPFVHQGRLRGAGVDCFGLPVCVLRDLGIVVDEAVTYHERPAGEPFVELAREVLDEIEPQDAGPGDFLAFWTRSKSQPKHAGIRTGYGLVHASDTAKKVVEHVMSQTWSEHVYAAFRLPGVL